jgi:hypothetical protein
MLNTRRHCVCVQLTSKQTNDQQKIIICDQGHVERTFLLEKHARTLVTSYSPSGMCPSSIAFERNLQK